MFEETSKKYEDYQKLAKEVESDPWSIVDDSKRRADERLLAAVTARRQRVDNHGAGDPLYWPKSIPVGGHVIKAAQLADVWRASERIKEDTAKPQDYDIVAGFLVSEEEASKRSRMQNLGNAVVGSVQFAGDIAASGGVGSVAGAASRKLLLEAIGKRFGGAAVDSILARAAGGVAKIAGESAVKAAAPAMLPRVAAGALDRGIPVVAPGIGELDTAREGKNAFKALAESYIDTVIEIGTEKAGEQFEHITKLLPPNVAQAIDTVSNLGLTSKQAKEVLNQFGIQGILPEILEERLGDVARGVTGNEDNYGTTGNLVTDPFGKGGQELLDEIAVLSAVRGVASVPFIPGTLKEYIDRSESRQSRLLALQAIRRSRAAGQAGERAASAALEKEGLFGPDKVAGESAKRDFRARQEQLAAEQAAQPQDLAPWNTDDAQYQQAPTGNQPSVDIHDYPPEVTDSPTNAGNTQIDESGRTKLRPSGSTESPTQIFQGPIDQQEGNREFQYVYNEDGTPADQTSKGPKYRIERMTDPKALEAFPGAKDLVVLKADSESEDGVVGHLVGHVRGNALQVKMADVGAEHRGKKIGIGMYEAMIDYARKNGLDFESDFSVSEDAARVYDGLMRRGYNVQRNPDAVMSKNDITNKGIIHMPVGRENESVFSIQLQQRPPIDTVSTGTGQNPASEPANNPAISAQSPANPATTGQATPANTAQTPQLDLAVKGSVTALELAKQRGRLSRKMLTDAGMRESEAVAQIKALHDRGLLSKSQGMDGGYAYLGSQDSELQETDNGEQVQSPQEEVRDQGNPPSPSANQAEPEAVKPRREFSSTQVNLPADVGKRVLDAGAKISDEDLIDKGRETEPHVTVKFGLHTNNVDDVRKVLANEPPIRVKLGKTSIFKQPDFDVVKADVDSPDLHALNAKLAKALPNTETHPEYKPHVTLAYVKPGAGEKYVGMNDLEGTEIVLDKLDFSDQDRNHTEIPLTGKRTLGTQKPVDPKTAAVEAANKYFDILLTEDPTTSKEQKEVEKFAERFNRTVIWFSERNLPPGFVLDGHDKFIFLDTSNSGDPMWELASEEIAHATGLDKIDGIDESLIDQSLRKYKIKWEAASSKGNKVARKILKQLENPKIARREGIANLFREFFADKSFRDRVLGKVPTAFQKIVEIIRNLFDGAKLSDARKAFLAEIDTMSAKPTKKLGEKASDKPVDTVTAIDSMTEEEIAAALLAEMMADAESQQIPVATPEPEKKPKEEPAPKPKKLGTKTRLEEVADKAEKEAEAANQDWLRVLKERGIFQNPFLDPVIMGATANMIAKNIKAKILTFSALIEKVTTLVGRDRIPKLRDYLVRGWDAAVKLYGVEPADYDQIFKDFDDGGTSQPGQNNNQGNAESGGSASTGDVETKSPTSGGATDSSGVAVPDSATGRKPDGGATGETVEAGNVPTGSSTTGGSGVPVDSGSSSGQKPGGSRTGGGRGGKSGTKKGAGAKDKPSNSGHQPGGRSGLHYKLTAADNVSSGGKTAKFDRNLEALRLLKAIEADNRKATADEQKVLAKLTGWGQLYGYFYTDKALSDAGVFDPRSKVYAWKAENFSKLGQPGSARPDDQEDTEESPDRERAIELLKLLSIEEYRAARASTPFSHYTSPEVAQAIWNWIGDALPDNPASLRVLEPAEGSGMFWGTMPDNLLAKAKMWGIDPDESANRIARQLYQDVLHDNRGFEEIAYPDNFFDVIVSNVPFMDREVLDPIDTDLNQKKAKLHNYFFLKAAKKVRQGGVVAFITTHFTMDAQAPAIRDAIEKYGLDFMGGVRLPNNAFQGIAGTKVTTDILFFQKGGKDVAPKNWKETSPQSVPYSKSKDRKVKTASVRVNNYFVSNPSHILGRTTADGGMRSSDPELTVEPHSKTDPLADLPYVLSRIPFDRVAFEANRGADESEAVQDQIELPESLKDLPMGHLVNHLGGMWLRNGKQTLKMIKPSLSDSMRDRLTAWNRLKKVTRDLKAAQIDTVSTDEQIEKLRAELNRVYDEIVKKHGGYLNGRGISQFVSADWNKAEMFALEKWNRETGKAEKMDIFRKRTMYPPATPQKTTNIKDALVASLKVEGGVSPEFIARLLDTTPDEAIRRMGDLVFLNPEGNYELREEYLSGNVRRKLAVAREKAAQDPAFQRNVDALLEVLPTPMRPGQFEIQLGSAWVPPELYADFANDTFRVQDVDIRKLGGESGGWALSHMRSSGFSNAENVITYGMGAGGDFTAVELLGKLLNKDSLTIIRRDREGRSYVDEQATNLAKAKAEKIEGAFKKWIWADNQRAERLAEIYNNVIRAHVEMKLPEWIMSLEGMSEEWKDKIRDYQKAGAARMLRGNTLLAYVVGAGKTLTAITGIMEARRLGTWRKPVVVVPNHLLLQWGTDFAKFYPNSQVLVATKDDFTPQRRQALFNRIATGDWDAIVVPQSSFKLMPMSPDYQRAFFSQQLLELENARAMEAAATDRNSPSVKAIEKMKKMFEDRMNKMLAAADKDPGPYMDELGIDSLIVDEAHDFKNLFFSTRHSRIPGISSTGNQKTFDMLMKTNYINETTNERGVTFLTGTPIANSMSEAWVMQRYLQPNTLREVGAYAFDDWKSTFGVVDSLTRVDPVGNKFRQEQRFNRFINLPELRRIFAQIADIKMTSHITLDSPPIEGGKPRVHKVDPGPVVSDYMMSLAARAANMPKDAPEVDNILVVMTDGTKASIDLRLVDPNAPAMQTSKLTVAADNIFQDYQDTNAFKGTQIVWLDKGVPKKPKKLTPQMRMMSQWLLDELQSVDTVSIDDLRAKYKEFDSTKSSGANFRRWLSMIEQDVRFTESHEDDDEAFNIGGKEDDDENPPRYVSAIESAEENITSDAPPKWNAYKELKDQLVAKGVPANEIRFIHDFDTPAKVLQAYEDMRNGKIRIMIANTVKMGTGANVQERLFAVHHIDAPWRPADLEQRNGRILRSGNKALDYAKEAGLNLAGVRIHNYTVQGIDARYWQTLEDKQSMLNQFYSGDETIRTASDIGRSSADDMAAIKALAAKNPLVMEEVKLTDTVSKLINERNAFESDKAQSRSHLNEILQHKLPQAKEELERNEQEAARLKERKAALPEDANIEIEIDGKTYYKINEAGQALIDKLAKYGSKLAVKPLEKPDGELSNFDKEFSSNTTPPIELATVYGRKMYAEISGGWRNTESGKTIAGNDYNLRQRDKLPIEDKEKWVWSFSGAKLGFRVLEGVRGPYVHNMLSLEGSAVGNITRINNEFNRVNGYIEEEKRRIAQLEDRIEPLRKNAEGVFEKEKELEESHARLLEIRSELGGKGGDELIRYWMPSRQLIEHFGLDSEEIQFLLGHLSKSGTWAGNVTAPDGKMFAVYTGKPSRETSTDDSLDLDKYPPRADTVWLQEERIVGKDPSTKRDIQEPVPGGRKDWYTMKDGKVFDQVPIRPEPPKEDEDPDANPFSDGGFEEDEGDIDPPAGVSLLRYGGSPVKYKSSVSPAMSKVPGIGATAKDSTTQKPIAAQDIIHTWERIFGVPIRANGFQQKADGLYYYFSQVVRIKESELTNIAVAAHEIAHHIDNLANVTRGSSPSLPVSLKSMMQGLDYEPSKNRDYEGWAEFIRMWLTDPKALSSSVQPLLDWFENTWMAKHPELAKQLQQARRHARQYTDQTVFQRISSMISDRGPEDLEFMQEWKNRLTSRMGRAYRHWVDKFEPLRVLEEEFKAKGGSANAIGPYEAAMAYDLTAVPHATMALERGVHNLVGDQITSASLWSLREHIRPGEYDEAIAYIYARHTLDRALHAPKYNTGLSYEQATEYMNAVEQDPGKKIRFEKVAIGLAKFNNALIEMMVDAGALDRPSAERMLKEYGDYYMPLHRVKDGDRAKMAAGGTKFVNLPRPVQGRSTEGSARNIIDPFDATVSRAIYFYGRATKARVAQALADTIDPNRGGAPGLGSLLTRVDPKKMVHVGKIEEILDTLVEEGVVDPVLARAMKIATRIIKGEGVSNANMAWFEARHNLISPNAAQLRAAALAEPNAMANIMLWRPNFSDTKDASKHIVMIPDRDGNPVLYEMDGELYRTVTGMDEVQLPAFLKILHTSAKYMKAGAVGFNTGFGVKNFLVDTLEYQGRAKNVEGLDSAKKPLEMVSRYIAYKAGRKDALIESYEEMGGKLYNRLGSDIASRQRERRRRLGKSVNDSQFGIVLDAKDYASRGLEAVQEMIAMSDAPARLAEMEAMAKKLGYEARADGWYSTTTGHKTTLPEAVRIRIMNAAAEATINFKRVGTYGQYINAYSSFFNATIQANYREWQQVKKLKSLFGGPKEDQAQAARYLVYLAAAASAGFVHWIFRHDDDDYREQAEWIRQHYWTIGWNGRTYWQAPRPRDAGGFVSALMEKALDVTFEDDTAGAWTEFLGDWERRGFFAQSLADRTPDLGGGLAKGLVETFIANYDYFRNRPLEDDYQQDKPSEQRSTPYTTDTSKTIGAITGRLFGVSPIQVEHLLASASGGMYRRWADTLDAARYGELEIKHIPGARSIYVNRHQARSIDDFYTELERAKLAAKREAAAGESNPETVAKVERLGDYKALLTGIRRLDERDARGQRKHVYEPYLVGLARAALGREEMEGNPDPFFVKDLPEPIAELLRDFASERADRVIISKGYPMKVHKGDESFDETVAKWKAAQKRDEEWLREHKSSPFIKEAIDALKKSESYRDLLARKGKPAFQSGHETWQEHVADYNRWLEKVERAQRWLGN